MNFLTGFMAGIALWGAIERNLIEPHTRQEIIKRAVAIAGTKSKSVARDLKIEFGIKDLK